MRRTRSNQQLETITVTGSNIRRVDIETSNPVITIDRAAIQKTGKLTLGDLVQQLPAVTGPNINPQVNNARRHGCLVDRPARPRLAAHAGADQRPSLSLRRSERDSGEHGRAHRSPDRRCLVGVRLGCGRGRRQLHPAQRLPGRRVLGELRHLRQGRRRAARVTSSRSARARDKGSIMAGISYNKTDQVLAGHRDFSKNSVSLYGNGDTAGRPASIGGSTSSPFGHVQIPDAFRRPLSRLQHGFLARNPGTSGQNIATDYHCYVNNGTPTTPSDKYNFATVNLIMTPQERTGLVPQRQLQADRQRRGLRRRSCTTRPRRRSSWRRPSTRAPCGVGHLGRQLLQPVRRRVRRTASTTSAARLASLGNRRGAFGTNTDQVSTGFKGSFAVWNDQQWNWEVGMDYGHISSATTTYGLPNLNIAESGDGSVVPRRRRRRHCGTPDASIDGCTPINIFNLNDPNTIAVLQAARLAGVSSGVFTQEKVWRADLNGGLFELPAGTVQLAVGASYRKEYTHIERRHVAADQSRDRQLRARQPVRLAAAGRLQRQGSLRRTVHADPQGRAVRPRVEPDGRRPLLEVQQLRQHEQLQDRARVASDRRPAAARHGLRSVPRADRRATCSARAASDAPKLSHDPCDGYTGNPAESGVRQRADRRHVPATRTSRSGCRSTRSRRVRSIAGFPLGPEFGKSFDFGVVYDPHFIEGLSVSADFWRLYLNNTITGVGAQSVLDLCCAGQLGLLPADPPLRSRVRTRARSRPSTSRPATSAASTSRAWTSR